MENEALNMKSGVWAALGAAVLPGLGTPIAKLLIGQASPLLLAAGFAVRAIHSR